MLPAVYWEIPGSWSFLNIDSCLLIAHTLAMKMHWKKSDILKNLVMGGIIGWRYKIETANWIKIKFCFWLVLSFLHIVQWFIFMSTLWGGKGSHVYTALEGQHLWNVHTEMERSTGLGYCIVILCFSFSPSHSGAFW